MSAITSNQCILAAGFDAKYLTMNVCSRGMRHRPNTIKFNAQIGTKKRSPGDRPFQAVLIWEICNEFDELGCGKRVKWKIVPYRLFVAGNYRATNSMVSSWPVSFSLGNFHTPKLSRRQTKPSKTIEWIGVSGNMIEFLERQQNCNISNNLRPLWIAVVSSMTMRFFHFGLTVLY